MKNVSQEYWNGQTLRLIGNRLGTFVKSMEEVDKNDLHMVLKNLHSMAIFTYVTKDDGDYIWCKILGTMASCGG